MSTKNKSFFEVMKSYNKNFWVASAMELFERWAWYGLFAVLALYLTGSTDEGGLGFTHTEKGQIMGIVTAILYLLPMITGVIADKIGYKLSLIIAYVLLITGYYFMGEVSSYTSVFLVFLWVAVGAAMFKPVASAIITKNTDKSNSTLGFGIFYMMVNIGGFIGPAFSSTLRTQYGWKIVFLQAAIVIGINLLILIFFYKEADRVKKEESIADAISSSIRNIWEAVKDSRLSVLLVIMVGFWTMFNQLFYTLPTFIEDWVNTKALHDSIAQVSPWLASFMSGGGNSINPEMLINLDAGSIILFQLIVSYFVLKMRHVSAMITGFIIASIGIGITFYTGNGLYTILGIMIFAIGEMMTNPTFSSFIALISPKGKEALYMGTYFLPIFLGNFLTTFVSGNLYQAWSDKLSLLQTEMGNRGLEMPEVTKEFTKNDYFALASEKLEMTQTQMTQLIWDTYNPNKIWYVIVAIGVVTILALTIYDRVVIRPKEAAEKVA
ncbi:dipeptide/tripeptide permease [Lutibacter oceani]|uniref:Dipeptide/tripeptide permease n=1 Tax=Lutibacter oceani TaxID=1853311 RepID=A0A3D9RTY6_9FLAO|nr:MFS transporter [Lutibacter oceani]REE80566.1 dipeptide/tripeptide permease [Lutibacter oceani]